MKIGPIIRELAGYLIGKTLELAFGAGRPAAPTAEDVRAELDEPSSLNETLKKAREDRDARWPEALREAAGQSMVYRSEPPPGGRCAQTCDHGSRCALPAGHDPARGHHTDHGCIAYDPPPGGYPRPSRVPREDLN